MGAPAVAMGEFSSRRDPESVERLKRKRKDAARRLDVLTGELVHLKQRRDEAASDSITGGGERAEREYQKLVKLLAEKEGDKERLQHAIAGFDAQIKEEREKVEAEQKARFAADNDRRKQAYLSIMRRERREQLEWFLSRSKTKAERDEINLQLEHLQEIVEAEYFNDFELRTTPPQPCKIVDGRPVPNAPVSPRGIEMICAISGLPARPRDLGKKKGA